MLRAFVLSGLSLLLCIVVVSLFQEASEVGELADSINNPPIWAEALSDDNIKWSNSAFTSGIPSASEWDAEESEEIQTTPKTAVGEVTARAAPTGLNETAEAEFPVHRSVTRRRVKVRGRTVARVPATATAATTATTAAAAAAAAAATAAPPRTPPPPRGRAAAEPAACKPAAASLAARLGPLVIGSVVPRSSVDGSKQTLGPLHSTQCGGAPHLADRLASTLREANASLSSGSRAPHTVLAKMLSYTNRECIAMLIMHAAIRGHQQKQKQRGGACRAPPWVVDIGANHGLFR